MIFAVSGGQGCGKSTVISGLKNKGYDVVDRKTARSVLIDWDVTLDQVNVDLELKKDFQSELLLRKIQDDLQHKDHNKITFTERSFADLFTYAVLNMGQYNNCDTWLNDYFMACAKAQNHYDGVFCLPSGMFQVVDDGVRSVNQYYSQVYDVTLKHFTHKSAYVPVIDIEEVDVEKRIELIEHTAISMHKVAHGVYE